MKKLLKMSLALGNGLVLQALFASPISAQVITPSPTSSPTATPTLRATPTSSPSSLPEAGTYTITLLIVVFGIALAVIGVLLMMAQQARQEARK